VASKACLGFFPVRFEKVPEESLSRLFALGFLFAALPFSGF